MPLNLLIKHINAADINVELVQPYDTRYVPVNVSQLNENDVVLFRDSELALQNGRTLGDAGKVVHVGAGVGVNRSTIRVRFDDSTEDEVALEALYLYKLKTSNNNNHDDGGGDNDVDDDGDNDDDYIHNEYDLMNTITFSG